MNEAENKTEMPEDLTIRWLEAGRVQVRWEPRSVRLIVRIDGGEEVADARVALAFPVTHPDGHVEFSNARGESLGIVKSLHGMAPDSLAALRAALSARYMIPLIIRLFELKEVSPFVLRWRVETDRGDNAFFTESPREAVRYLGHDRVRITDLSGNHFDIPSLSGLDAASRTHLSAFL